MPEDSEAELDDETQALLSSDFEIGHYIRERIVPRAVLYYTGILYIIYSFYTSKYIPLIINYKNYRIFTINFCNSFESNIFYENKNIFISNIN